MGRPPTQAQCAHHRTIPYLSERDARATARMVEQHRTGPKLHPYQCATCGWWFLSSTPRRARRRTPVSPP